MGFITRLEVFAVGDFGACRSGGVIKMMFLMLLFAVLITSVSALLSESGKQFAALLVTLALLVGFTSGLIII